MFDRWLHRKSTGEKFSEQIDLNTPITIPATTPAQTQQEQLEQELEGLRHRMHILSKQAQEEDTEYIDRQKASQFFEITSQQEREPLDPVQLREAQLRRAIYELEQQHEQLMGENTQKKD
ncbi:hypothetical protein HYV86_06885 [Candidatus Woesearchaeota archaeon]|nr:hypothetical protein [Candidatus Woesearchaeota archaeon]